MTEAQGPEGQTIDQRLLGLSPEQVAELARTFYGDGSGPLDGPYVPTGSGTVRTASGRPPEVAETEGPLPAAPVPEDGPPGSPPAQPPSGPSAGPPATIPMEVIRAAAEMLAAQGVNTRYGPAALVLAQQRTQQGPPPGYRPPEDQTREEPFFAAQEHAAPINTIRRFLREVPNLVRASLPNSRERAIVLRALDDARLWFEEAVREQTQPPQEPPPKG